VKDLKEIQTPERDVKPSETPNSSVIRDDTVSPAEKSGGTTVPDAVPVTMLPPRKRLKASVKTERSTGVNDNSTAGVDKPRSSGVKYENLDLSTLLDLGHSSVVQPAVNKSNKTISVSKAPVSNSGTASSDRAVLANLNSAAKNSFASLSAPLPPPSRVPLQQEPIPRGRKSRQVTSANPQPVAVRQNWTARNDNGQLPVIPPTPPMVVAATAPNVIHIPEDARVFQTDDGMIIICQSDGTVQIHGHTEGQPIPLDAIRSLLALDTTGDQTVYAVSDQTTQETGHSLYGYGQSIPITGPQSGYETLDPMNSAEGTQNVIQVDANQQMILDGSQALMAYDPSTQSVVHIDPGQFITLADGNTLVAVDGTQSMIPIDGLCHAEQGVVGNSALLQLLPNSHKQ